MMVVMGKRGGTYHISVDIPVAVVWRDGETRVAQCGVALHRNIGPLNPFRWSQLRDRDQSEFYSKDPWSPLCIDCLMAVLP